MRRPAAPAAVAGLAWLLAAAAAAATPTWELPPPHARIETEAPVDRAALPPDHPAWPISTVLGGATDRYPHAILGSVPGWAQLTVVALSCGACRHGVEAALVVLPERRVFEDVAARLWDVTGDGRPEIVVVESDISRGARLTVWGYTTAHSGRPGLRLLAATAPIGRPFRWLAPAGIADFDGDGLPDIAYVETPHIAPTLHIVTLTGEGLVAVAPPLPGPTNHRIGDSFIAGGLRDCGGGPELVLASADWRQILRVRLDQATGRLQALPAGPLAGDDPAAALAAARRC
ncbi:MAG: VCBS repeat-containing protein [Rhodobacteraceae bacterium]|jgi:hypothetical protein|nr:VCBS repeat-containing protein [Paracoccaceae bacterium]